MGNSKSTQRVVVPQPTPMVIPQTPTITPVVIPQAPTVTPKPSYDELVVIEANRRIEAEKQRQAEAVRRAEALMEKQRFEEDVAEKIALATNPNHITRAIAEARRMDTKRLLDEMDEIIANSVGIYEYPSMMRKNIEDALSKCDMIWTNEYIPRVIEVLANDDTTSILSLLDEVDRRIRKRLIVSCVHHKRGSINRGGCHHGCTPYVYNIRSITRDYVARKLIKIKDVSDYTYQVEFNNIRTVTLDRFQLDINKLMQQIEKHQKKNEAGALQIIQNEVMRIERCIQIEASLKAESERIKRAKELAEEIENNTNKLIKAKEESDRIQLIKDADDYIDNVLKNGMYSYKDVVSHELEVAKMGRLRDRIYEIARKDFFENLESFQVVVEHMMRVDGGNTYLNSHPDDSGFNQHRAYIMGKIVECPSFATAGVARMCQRAHGWNYKWMRHHHISYCGDCNSCVFGLDKSKFE